MTKTECVIGDIGFERVYNLDSKADRHDGSKFVIRYFVYRDENDVEWVFRCESYYGSARLFRNGVFQGDFETVYETIADYIRRG